MTKCQVCGSEAQAITAAYHVENLLGVRVGLVNCVKKIVCDACGEETITIPDVNGLVAAVAVARTMIPTKLNGTEIKFLRKAVDLSAKDLAGVLGIRPETVSRWENDPAQQIGSSDEKLFRIMVGHHLKEAEEDRAPAVDYDERDILEMTINPIRKLGDEPLMNFERVRVKIKKKTQEAWDGAEMKAA